mmetsp:Transcript_23161/g.61937  ORF Transcript_23161/g.61937 Transcript_23161/m.61937 type:complete len:326 (-) Transcript_23161:1297-2274(-)
MTRIRIEGLLAAFPKLLGTGNQQHTFIETDSVRYVYQPIEGLFLLLITNKASNIVEDLETLRLLSKVLPDQAGGVTEEAVQGKMFELVFAFDEVITTGGYREQISLQQIQTNLSMESHEEKLHKMIEQSKVASAKDEADRRAKTIRGPSVYLRRARMRLPPSACDAHPTTATIATSRLQCRSCGGGWRRAASDRAMYARRGGLTDLLIVLVLLSASSFPADLPPPLALALSPSRPLALVLSINHIPLHQSDHHTLPARLPQRTRTPPHPAHNAALFGRIDRGFYLRRCRGAEEDGGHRGRQYEREWWRQHGGGYGRRRRCLRKQR